MLTGDKGILKQAGNAKNITEQTQLEQEVDIAYLAYTDQARKKNDLEYYLNKIDDANVEKLVSGTWYVSRGDSSVTVSDDGEKEEGKTEIWDGTGIKSPEFKEFNWYIYTPSQLKFFADFVNNGNSLTGTVDLTSIVTNAGYRPSDVKIDTTTIVYLMKNIDMGARPGNGSTEEQKWEIESNESRKWTPIGPTDELKFIGTFEGNNNTIKGMYVNQTKGFAGLFANSNTIQNLTMKDGYIKGGGSTGGIVGAIKTGKIENCHNENVVVILRDGNNYVAGGVVASLLPGSDGAYNCSNTGSVIGYGIKAFGDINMQFCGGIVGLAEATNISNCTNEGIVIGNNQGDGSGGIIGYTNSSVSINRCNNSGTVKGNRNLIGGITGTAGTSSIINECNNKGTIEGNGNRVGGIAGNINTNNSISGCNNSGSIKGTIQVGGIVGEIANKKITNSTIERCYNSGDINGVTNVGGIAGRLSGSQGQGTVKECYNKGIIEGTTNVGEIMGGEINKTGLNTLNKLFYLKNKRGLTAIGGEADNETNKIKDVTDNLTYEQFKTWITEQ